MNDENVREHVNDLMVKSGIAVSDGNTISYFQDGREYLLLLAVFDVTDWGDDK